MKPRCLRSHSLKSLYLDYPPINDNTSRKQFLGVRQQSKPVPLYLSPFLCFKTGLAGLAIVRHGLTRACIETEQFPGVRQKNKPVPLYLSPFLCFKTGLNGLAIVQHGLRRAYINIQQTEEVSCQGQVPKEKLVYQ